MMSSDGKSGGSAPTGAKVKDYFELVSKNTFRWAVACNGESIQDFEGLENKVHVGGHNGFPRMIWTFTLPSSSHLEDQKFKDLFGEYYTKAVEINEVMFRYDCDVHNGVPPPMYRIRISALGSNELDKHTWDKEIHKSELRNNTFGEFLLGRLPIPRDSIPKVNDIFVFAITLEFYRLSDQVGVRSGNLNIWNKPHENTEKIHVLQMLKSGHLSDVKIISMDGQEFRAHKIFLRAGSEVFEAMFRNDMTESRNGVINLDDMSSKEVEFLLHYIYSSELLPISFEDDDDEAAGDNVSIEDVVDMAFKYGLNDLIKYFDEGMKSLCNEKNSMRLLKLCEKYSLEKGSDDVFEFVVTGHIDVLKRFVRNTLQKK